MIKGDAMPLWSAILISSSLTALHRVRAEINQLKLWHGSAHSLLLLMLACFDKVTLYLEQTILIFWILEGKS